LSAVHYLQVSQIHACQPLTLVTIQVCDDLEVDLAAWSWDPLVLLGAAASGYMYVRGWLRMGRRNSWRAASFGGGLVLILVALCSPIGTYDQQLFSLHMTEHLLLALGAAPLLLLGKPLVPMLWSLPPTERRGVARLFGPGTLLGRAAASLVRPPVALGVYSLSFAVWHVPRLYDLAQGATPIHYAEHAVFFTTALAFWWPVIHPHGGPRRLAKIAAIVYFALPMFEGTLIGGLLTFANAPLYATYAQTPHLGGLSALDDQQLAGLIMWIPGGLVYAAAVLALLVSVLRDEEAGPSRVWRSAQSQPPPVASDDPVLFENA
jgi:putative membrane protein